jgi:7-cyano-7-deazaguanine synthase
MSKKLVLSFSGGADSSVLLYMAADRGYDEVYTVTFDYGQRHRKEMASVPLQKWNLRSRFPQVVVHNKVINASYIRDVSPTSSLTNNNIDNPDISKIAGDAQPVSYVPFRNQMFLSICCAYAESLKVETVWYGAAQVDSLAGYWDGDKPFVEKMNELTSLNRDHRILIEAPLLSLSKADIVREGVRLGVKFEDTWTCYSDHPSGYADATTPASSLRIKGFIDAGYRDPITYLQQDKLEKLYEQHNCKSL